MTQPFSSSLAAKHSLENWSSTATTPLARWEEDMEYAIGAVLALVVGAGATAAGLDRDRAFYPTVLIVIASYYDLFAVLAGSAPVLGLETVALAVFAIAAIVGFRTSPWIVVGALASHAIFDVFHGGLIANPGVPAWWPAFCLTYDLAAAGYLAWRILRTGAAQASSAAARQTA